VVNLTQGREVPADNGFDLLRLLLALIVCVAHIAQLSAVAALAWIPSVQSSLIAVESFFVISGFLIVMSYERSRSLRSYAMKRVRRLYPAYVVVIMLCALLLVFVSELPPHAYFSHAWLAYVGLNLSFLNFLHADLPGVFVGQNLNAVNGALWTIKIEVMFYIAVPFIVWACRRFGSLRVLAACYLGSVVYCGVLSWLAQHTGSDSYEVLARQFPGQLSYFVAGAALYYLLPVFKRFRWAALGTAVPVLLANAWLPLPWIEPAAMAVVVIFAGLFLPSLNAARFGDFSYGLYIVHFPIVQVLVHEGAFNSHPWAASAMALALSMTGAALMWHGVEKRFLGRRSHYVAVEGSSGEGSGVLALS
jgi:peptidoglycan/LPS O-acetylase OafA/YrhL